MCRNLANQDNSFYQALNVDSMDYESMYAKIEPKENNWEC